MAQSLPVSGERRIGGMLSVTRQGKKTSVVGTLDGFVFKEGRAWVAYCRSLDLSSCGTSPEAALRAVEEAIGLWIESCIERGTLEAALSELGWVCQDQKGQLADCRQTKLPPAFMIERMTRTGNEWSRPIRFEAS